MKNGEILNWWIVVSMLEVIFVEGPPFGGKTHYCNKHFTQSHKYVNGDDILKQESAAAIGLRAVTRPILDHLRSG